MPTKERLKKETQIQFSLNDEAIIKKLRQRATENGLKMNAFVRMILYQSLKD